jgi:xylulokinase
MLVHSENIGLKTQRIIATGGASRNSHILAIMANVFGVPVLVHSTPNSACLGAAYRALHGWKSAENLASFDQIMSNAKPFKEAAKPDGAAHQQYATLVQRYRHLEQVMLKEI